MSSYCKFYKEQKYVSDDGGSTWSATTEYRKGALIEVDSPDCGYVPPTPTVSGDYLTFSIQTNGKFSLENQNAIYAFEYSRNGESWTTAETDSDIYVSAGDLIKLRGNITPQQIASRLQGGIGTFEATCEFAASGNPMSMIVGDNFSGVTSLASYPFAFAYLFHSCSGLKDINGIQLPFETLSDNCYRAMFTSVGITALTTNILSAATAVTSNCYYNMFNSCSLLQSVPSGLLPHTTLAYNCYNAMFFYCELLQTAPTLPAPTLAERCYENMFLGCATLNYIECHATDISASNCTYSWVMAVGFSGTFVTPSSTNWSTDVSGIPNGWTRVDL